MPVDERNWYPFLRGHGSVVRRVLILIPRCKVDSILIKYLGMFHLEVHSRLQICSSEFAMETLPLAVRRIYPRPVIS